MCALELTARAIYFEQPEGRAGSHTINLDKQAGLADKQASLLDKIADNFSDKSVCLWRL